MKEEHKMNPESSREIASLIFTQSFKPVADLIEDRLAQHAREAEKSPMEFSLVPKINIKNVASPFQQNGKGRLKDLGLSDRSLSVGERETENGRIDVRSVSPNSTEREQQFTMTSSKRLIDQQSQIKQLKEANKEVRMNALKWEKEAKTNTKLLSAVSSISVLMSFKLADLVNIALEDGSYFKTSEWCERNKGRLLVEHEQLDWQR